jgi:hypothetical protein
MAQKMKPEELEVPFSLTYMLNQSYKIPPNAATELLRAGFTRATNPGAKIDLSPEASRYKEFVQKIADVMKDSKVRDMSKLNQAQLNALSGNLDAALKTVPIMPTVKTRSEIVARPIEGLIPSKTSPRTTNKYEVAVYDPNGRMHAYAISSTQALERGRELNPGDLQYVLRNNPSALAIKENGKDVSVQALDALLIANTRDLGLAANGKLPKIKKV